MMLAARSDLMSIAEKHVVWGTAPAYFPAQRVPGNDFGDVLPF
jgi:hypothetical protein